MWLLTAIGPVHGQQSFTFALEQRKTYTIGRDKACDIRFESRYVKPIQGRLTVGDWDPNNPTSPPVLQWRPELSKKGVYPAFNSIIPASEDLFGSSQKADYEVIDMPEGKGGIYLHDNKGQGVELADDCWFSTLWQPFSICYERLNKDEAVQTDLLIRFCIPHLSTFEETSPPDLVISPSFKSSTPTNYAVCYGVRILLPLYLETLQDRLNACWKKVADSQDSFGLPDQELDMFQPTLDAALPNTRRGTECWVPDKRRKTLFKGWKIFGLRPKVLPGEKRYLLAMGASYTEIDIVANPIKSAADFEERLSGWVEEVNREGRREKALVVYFARVKEELQRLGANFGTDIVVPCQKHGIIIASGAVCWGAVKSGGVQAYIEQVTGQTGMNPPAVTTSRKEAAVEASVPASVASVPPSQVPSAPVPPAVSQTPAIPSTFPDESEGAKGETTIPSTQREASPEAVEASSSVRKPLRRRAAKVIDLFADDLSVIPESMPMPMDTEPSQPTQRVVSSTQRSQIKDSQDSQSQPLEETSSLAPRSRLKRRAAGAETQKTSQFDFGFDDSYEADRKAEQTAAEIREVYEQTRASSRQPPNKRQRMSTDPESIPSVGSRTTRSAMDIDDTEEAEEVEDPMEDLKRKARAAITQASAPRKPTQSVVPPPSRHVKNRVRSPSEEVEEIESKTKKSKKAGETTAVTKDQNFLQAISKATKSKKAIDELDKEFNNLRIPKIKGKDVIPATSTTYDHPDWNLVDEFDDELRGNFIQIVKKDLFRKDLGEKRVERVDDGRPNFKKFKKKNIVRREPVRLALVGQDMNDAEMGEPYWVAESGGPSSKGVGMSQAVGSMRQEEDEMPLLPRSKKRLINVADSPPPEDNVPATGRRKFVVPSQTTQTTQATQRPVRKTRATSVASDVLDAPSAPTRAKPAVRGKKTVEPVVIEDSEDEVALDLGKTPSTATRTGRGAKSRAAASTLDVDTAGGGGTRRTTRTTQASMIPDTSQMEPPPSTATASGRPARRKLLVDDDNDDDVVVFKGLQKKRRLG